LKDFPKGAYVYRKDTNRKLKAHKAFVGPYQVVTKLNDGAYLLRDAAGKFFSSPVAAEFLKLALISKKDQDADDIYKVKKILAHKGPSNRREFKVR
jgi:hypothetical protein